MIDYILANNKYRSSVKDVKVIPGEEIVSFDFRKKSKLWRLRELEVKEEFAEGFNNKCDSNEDWCGLKRKLLDVVSEVCTYTKDKPKHLETWW